MKKTIKGFAVLRKDKTLARYGFPFFGLSEKSSPFGIYAEREAAENTRKIRQATNVIVPCTITFTLPTKKK